MHAIFYFSVLCTAVGFSLGIYAGGKVRSQLQSLHTKADAILAAVRRV